MTIGQLLLFLFEHRDDIAGAIQIVENIKNDLGADTEVTIELIEAERAKLLPAPEPKE